jgi:hypothetical protein
MSLALLLLATVFPVIIVSGFTALIVNDLRSNRSMAKMVEARRASR